MQLLGFDAHELARIRPARRARPDRARRSARTRPRSRSLAAGDLWLLGEHRLLCGDSTERRPTWTALMDGEKAARVATDPPYLVDYTGERPDTGGNSAARTGRPPTARWTSRTPTAFFRGVFTNVLRVLAPNAAIYCWHAHKRQATIERVWEELGILDHQQIIWVKPTAVFGRVYWHFRHEPCMMGWVKGSKPEHARTSHWSTTRCGRSTGRARPGSSATSTPRRSPSRCSPGRCGKHTRARRRLLRAVLRAGCQIIAAEQLGRRCYAMELEPVFVDSGGGAGGRSSPASRRGGLRG